MAKLVEIGERVVELYFTIAPCFSRRSIDSQLIEALNKVAPIVEVISYD